MKDEEVNKKARLVFGLVLSISLVAGGAWYLLSLDDYTVYQIHTRDSVSGLVVDAPVEFHGVDIGKVKDIELIDANSISVLLRVRKTAPISAATVAAITSRGLAARGFTGYVYVALEDTGTDFRKLVTEPGKRYPVIPTATSRSVSLDITLSEVHDNLQFITALLQTVLDEKMISSLKQSVDSLQQITRTLAENDKKLGAIIKNAEQASNQLKPLLESSNDAVKAFQTQLLPEAHKTLSNLDTLSNSLTAVIAEISRDPSILIRGTAPPKLGPGEAK